MKVVELIIDVSSPKCSIKHTTNTIQGYKSYAVRTVISGWDPTFNAITGLNGSGKSNILDSICFVLGITNMSTVRAQNLQDLIYKRGQAGVTKASVTIVFDNNDKSNSPIGFEEYAQISEPDRSCWGALANTSSMDTERSKQLYRTSSRALVSTLTIQTFSSCKDESPKS
jgi:AAA15 family ATPase/GTPase